MGEAKRKKFNSTQGQNQTVDMPRLAKAMRQLGEACSSHDVSDCVTHAKLCAEFLKRAGLKAHLAAGAAAWRVGNGDGSVVSHLPSEQQHTTGFPLHCWVEIDDHHTVYIFDSTTYTLPQKVKVLDSLDGTQTDIVWQQEFIYTKQSKVKALRSVANGNPGDFYYQNVSGLADFIYDKTGSVDEDDLANLVLIYQNEPALVIGPQ